MNEDYLNDLSPQQVGEGFLIPGVPLVPFLMGRIQA